MQSNLFTGSFSILSKHLFMSSCSQFIRRSRICICIYHFRRSCPYVNGMMRKILEISLNYFYQEFVYHCANYDQHGMMRKILSIIFLSIQGICQQIRRQFLNQDETQIDTPHLDFTRFQIRCCYLLYPVFSINFELEKPSHGNYRQSTFFLTLYAFCCSYMFIILKYKFCCTLNTFALFLNYKVFISVISSLFVTCYYYCIFS